MERQANTSMDNLSSALDQLEHLETANIEEILNSLCVDSGQREHFLNKALHVAIDSGLVHTVDILITHGADQVLDVANDYGNTPLIMASIRNYGNIISLLLQAGCLVNRTDMESRTALHWTAMAGNVRATEELLLNGSWPDHPDKVYCFTPLMLAARQGHTDIVRLLLGYECDVNRRDLHSETPLFDAVRNNNIDCMKLLIDAGADVDALDKYLRTPLYTGIMYGHLVAMRLLIDQNCSLVSLGNQHSPLEVAVIEVQEEPCKMMVASGADITCLHRYLAMRTESTFSSGLSVKEWIAGVLSEPPKCLKHLARLSIRRFYESNLPRIVHNLPLPTILKNYLMLPEITLCAESSDVQHNQQAYVPLYKSTAV